MYEAVQGGAAGNGCDPSEDEKDVDPVLGSLHACLSSLVFPFRILPCVSPALKVPN